MANLSNLRPARRASAILMGLALMIAVSGCVTQGKYEEAIAERDEFQVQKELLELRNTELVVQLESASNNMLILDDRLQRNQSTLAQIEETYGELVDQLASEVEAGKIKVEVMKSGLNIRISEEILFDSGSADLDEEGRDVIRRLASELEGVPYQIVVAGYSDNVRIGGALAARYPTNWDLAGARSSHVVAVLQEAGVPQEQLLSVSFGSNQPLVSNDTPEGRLQNRRIEVRIRPVISEAESTPDVASPPPWE